MIKPKNLLIVRTDRIGDVILSLPLVQAIKKHYPDSRITFLMREYTKALAEGNPFIDEILLLKTRGDKVLIGDNVKEISSRNFDTVIIVYPTFVTALILFLSGIKNRIGTGYRWYSFLFNNKIYEHRKYAEKHELEYNFSLLSLIGIKEISEEDKSKFYLKKNPAAHSKVTDIIRSKGIDFNKIIIIVHPGSGGSSVDLPMDKYRELISLITSNFDCQVVITGSSSETEKCQTLVVNHGVINLAGAFNLAELVALIDLSVIFISNSTGPLHIAAALGKYVIGFYPKVKACSAERWGPYTDKGYIFTPEIECDNCTVEQCLKLNCMSSIDIIKVFEKIKKILKLLPDTGDKDAK
jgi:heptosyltransferase III